MEIIDSHHHLWDLDLFQYEWMPENNPVLRQSYLPSRLRQILDKCGVRGTVLVQADQSVEEAKFLLKCAREFPWIMGVVGWVDLQNENVGDILDELLRLGPLVGIRHQVEEENDDNWLLRKSTMAGLRAVAERDLSYDLLTKPIHLDQIPSLCEELPHLRMVVDHISKPNISDGIFKPWSQEISKLGRYKNLYCKVSGMVTEADHKNWTTEDLFPYVQHVREVFGIERLMWGSDWPVCLLAASYEEVMEAAITTMGSMSAIEKKMFLCDNATGFYRLK